jgi:hypothetical protein
MWNFLYKAYAVIVLFTAAMFIWQYIQDRPMKKLKFITKAYNEGCFTVAKMTCLTLHGYNEPQHFKAEYMYVVDGKRYFITYEMAYHLPIDGRVGEMNADMLLLKLKPCLMMFYDKKKPKKAMSKIEVFTSDDGIHQINTPKRNQWRNIEKDWTDPIDLVSY